MTIEKSFQAERDIIFLLLFKEMARNGFYLYAD